MARAWMLLVGAALAVPAGAGQQGASGFGQPATATPSVQQAFQAAEAIDVTKQPAAALAAWEALEKRVAANRRSRAIIAARKAGALVRLNRPDEAVAAARAALADLPMTDASLAEDRWNALTTIALSARDELDHAGAAQAYADAEQAAVGRPWTLSALIGLVETATFTDPDRATQALARIDALTAGQTVSKVTEARIADARAVLLMNTGDAAGARAAATRAVALRGGVTEKTDLNDVASRSNAAIASLLAGREDEARRYMAMTGAGRIPTGQLDPGPVMTPPECGGEAGLKPGDMAVVQFSIGDDGSVVEVEPIYSAAGGRVALEFARAARRWSWTREQAAQLPPFFRYRARVELRCTQAFQRPSVTDALRARLGTWLAEHAIELPPATQEGTARAVGGQRAALAGKDGMTAVPLLVQLAESPLVGREETAALASRGLAQVTAAGAPPAARLWFDLIARRASQARQSEAQYRVILAALMADRTYAADPQARGALRLLAADAEERGSSRTGVLLSQVADDAAIPAADPVKVGALIRLASLAQDRGDAAGARAAFARSGLAPSQCALLDSPPPLARVGGTFPEEARRWGFEGWTRAEFDIGADGKVSGERAIISYPPFVFTKAGEATMRTATFAKTFRPDGGLGCGATNRNVRFLMGS